MSGPQSARFSDFIDACFWLVVSGSPFGFFGVGAAVIFQAAGAGLEQGSAVHATALMGSFGIVGDKSVIEHILHLFDGFEAGLGAFDTEVLAKHGTTTTREFIHGVRGDATQYLYG